MPKTRLNGLARAVATGVAAAVFIAGCGEDGPALVGVTGTVTENGEPLADAAVIFTPTDGGAARPGEDVTGPQGNFKLMTNRRSGVAPGKYHVVVTKAAPKLSGDAAALHPDDPYMATLSTTPAGSKKKSTQPTEFTFEREVTAEAKQVIDLDVKTGGTAAVEKSVK
jgi:hypothetical protein